MAIDTPGFYRLEAWPDPVVALVRISYDPTCADEDTIKLAMVEPYYGMAEDRWWLSPFTIEGYTPPGLDNCKPGILRGQSWPSWGLPTTEERPSED
jgi:hypothetical protein